MMSDSTRKAFIEAYNADFRAVLNRHKPTWRHRFAMRWQRLADHIYAFIRGN